jgi:UV DNA damage repair endonuclease
MTQRIGFACKFLLDSNSKKTKSIVENEKALNTSSTTVAWLNRQSRTVAEDRLWSVATHNLASVQRVLALVANMNPALRMMRIGSDLLPVYTESTWGYFWQQSDVRNWCEKEFAKIGEFARKHDIRLSFHPGQFTVLASENDDIVQRSIDEFEYHTDMARWMGYGANWHDHGFKINVHISGRRGPQGIIDVLPRLSLEARNLITIENDENSWGLDDSIKLENDVALVIDIHHHWVREGEYIQPSDDRVKRVIDSWRGVRPTIHYSVSREDVLLNHDTNTLPDMATLLTNGYKKAKLRAHSDDCWNNKLNEWALGFLPQCDIMVEAKLKNIAANTLYRQVV